MAVALGMRFERVQLDGWNLRVSETSRAYLPLREPPVRFRPRAHLSGSRIRHLGATNFAYTRVPDKRGTAQETYLVRALVILFRSGLDPGNGFGGVSTPR